MFRNSDSATLHLPERAKADTLDAAGLEQFRIRRPGDMLAEVRTALTRLRPVSSAKNFSEEIRGPNEAPAAASNHRAQNVNNSGPLAAMRGVFFERMSGRIKYFVVGHVAQRTLPPED